MIINNSDDITNLQVRFVVDLTDKEPRLFVENLSAGPALQNVVMAFEAYSPNNIKIMDGNLGAPNAVGNFVSLQLPAAFAFFNGTIEWSGNTPYRFYVHARDSKGNIYKGKVQSATICEPRGNKAAGKHYGAATMDLHVDCTRGELIIKDVTNYSYNGQPGVLIEGSNKVSILAPEDETGQVPPPKEYPGFSTVLHQLTHSGIGYKAVLATSRAYDLGNDVTVKFRYIKSEQFNVDCDYDLCPLVAEVTKFLLAHEGKCDTATNYKIGLINAKLQKAIIAKMQPLCGYDIGKIIKEIKELIGVDVDCKCVSGKPIGFNVTGNTAGGFNFQFNTEGDATAGAQVNGNNILIDIRDFKYIFNVTPYGNPANPQAFTVMPSIDGRTKLFTLNVNRDILAKELLDTIEVNHVLLEKLRDLTKSNFDFIVDGKGVIQTNAQCDQELTVADVPAAGSFVMLKTIVIDGITYTLNVNVNGTQASLDNLNLRLSNLNKGVITAMYVPEDGVLRLVSLKNAYRLTGGTVWFPQLQDGGVDRPMNNRQWNCNNSVPYQPSTIVQAIIDFLMKMTASNIMIGKDITMCQIGADGKVSDVMLHRTDSLEKLIDVLRSNSCRIAATNGSGGVSLSCESIKALFNEKIEAIGPTDVLYGTRNSRCGQWSIEDLVRATADLIVTTNDASLKKKFCDAVAVCYTDGSGTCNPVPYVEAKLATLGMDAFILGKGECGGGLQDALNCYSLSYVGRNINDTLDFPVTIVIKDQIIATGVMGTNTRTIVMDAGQNYIADVLTAYPGPVVSPLRRMVIESVTPSAAGLNKKYLQVRIKNNGAANYKVAFRLRGSTEPFTYATIPAVAGTYTTAIFDVPENEYETSTKVVCGPNSESKEVLASVSSCPTALTFSAVRAGQNFLFNYKFPAGISKFQLRIKYPNNGKYEEIHPVAQVGSLLVPTPTNVYGNFLFDIRAVCNEETGYFGPWTDQIQINVPQPTNSCPLVQGVEILEATESSVKLRILSPADTSGVAGYTVMLSAVGVNPISKTIIGANPEVEFTGLASSKRWAIQVITNCGDGVVSSTFAGGFVFTTAPTGSFRAYWGVKGTAGNLTVAQIKQSGNSAEFQAGADVSCDYTFNTISNFHWVAIPASQPIRNKWFVTVQNEGDIGPFPNAFSGPATIQDGNETWHFYISNYKTKQGNLPVVFKP